MSRVVVTTACTIPASLGYNGFPAQFLTKGMVLEVTAAEAAAIASAGGVTRPVAVTMHDTLGEAFAASNSSA